MSAVTSKGVASQIEQTLRQERSHENISSVTVYHAAIRPWQLKAGRITIAILVIAAIPPIVSLAGVGYMSTTAAWAILGGSLGGAIASFVALQIPHILFVKKNRALLPTLHTHINTLKSLHNGGCYSVVNSSEGRDIFFLKRPQYGDIKGRVFYNYDIIITKNPTILNDLKKIYQSLGFDSVNH